MVCAETMPFEALEKGLDPLASQVGFNVILMTGSCTGQSTCAGQNQVKRLGTRKLLGFTCLVKIQNPKTNTKSREIYTVIPPFTVLQTADLTFNHSLYFHFSFALISKGGLNNL